MAFIQVPTDGTGKKVLTYTVPTGEHIEVVDVAPFAPKFGVFTTVNLAAGASQTWNSVAISTGVTGYLAGVDVAASVPLKVELFRVAAGTPTALTVFWTQDARLSEPWRPPHNSYFTQAGGATNNWRVTVTNLDNIDAADGYATLYWDER